MSLFGSIMSRIFGHAGAGTPQRPDDPAARQASPASTLAQPASPAGQPQQAVDVSAVLDGLAAQQKQRLDWRHSIVDMLKLLELDSSLAARQQLAQELHYTGDAKDSAAMNTWLHGQVMTRLAENGGKVPEDLRSQKL